MSSVGAPMKINAFAKMKDIITSEMKAQGITAADIRKELLEKKHGK
ncbi:hypothetical protein [Scopulibacillus darangshiensis]|nr:hypothetical protein [Scopulibacillus darangshiensis]